jgi:hypothetical protein
VPLLDKPFPQLQITISRILARRRSREEELIPRLLQLSQTSDYDQTEAVVECLAGFTSRPAAYALVELATELECDHLAGFAAKAGIELADDDHTVAVSLIESRSFPLWDALIENSPRRSVDSYITTGPKLFRHYAFLQHQHVLPDHAARILAAPKHEHSEYVMSIASSDRDLAAALVPHLLTAIGRRGGPPSNIARRALELFDITSTPEVLALKLDLIPLLTNPDCRWSEVAGVLVKHDVIHAELLSVAHQWVWWSNIKESPQTSISEFFGDLSIREGRIPYDATFHTNIIGWVVTIFENWHLSCHRKEKRRRELLPRCPLVDFAGDTRIDEEFIRQEHNELIKQALEHVGERDLAVLKALFVDKERRNAVAAKFNMKVDAVDYVKTRVKRLLTDAGYDRLLLE